MKNLIQNGERINFTAAADLSAGDLAFVGDLAVVAPVDIASGAVGVGYTRGVFELPKAADPIAFSQGDPVYWDATAGKCTSASANGANRRVGIAWDAALAAASVVNVAINLNPSNTVPQTIPIPLGAITMEDGTPLAKQATTVAGYAQLADKERVILIPVDCTAGENLGFDVPLPQGLDVGQDVTIHALVGKDADNDALTLDCEVYPVGVGDVGNADIQDTAAQVITQAVSELIFTCGYDGLLASPSALSVVLSLGGTNDGDAVRIYAVWVEIVSRQPAMEG